MTNATYGKLTAGLIVAWFTFSLSASALHLFRTDPSRPPLPLLLAVVIPIFLFFLWYRSSRSFRDFVLSLNPQTLTIVQAWRIVGFVFLVLYTYDIGLGITDLVAAVGLGGMARFIGQQGLTNLNGITTAPNLVLPLSLIPTFGVPLFLILHIICIAQARRWPKQTYSSVGARAGSLAA